MAENASAVMILRRLAIVLPFAWRCNAGTSELEGEIPEFEDEILTLALR
jgi:hypothetical protein